MGTSLIRGKFVVSRIVDQTKAVVINNGAVLQRDGMIVDIGEYRELKDKYEFDEEIGSFTQIVIPGLINAHHHVGLTPFQLGALDEPLETWIISRWALRDVDPYLDTLYCALQMIESGITTVMHNHMAAKLPTDMALFDGASEVINAYEDSGMRVAFSLSHRDQNHLVYEDDEKFLSTLPSQLAFDIRTYLNSRPITLSDYLDTNTLLLGKKQTSRTNIFISPHNVHWCSDHMLLAMSDFARINKTGLHIHVQETIYQKMYGTRHWSKSPLGHLMDLGVLGPEVSCAHGVWMTESDISILAETGTAICHNPSSNLRLKSGIAPLNHLLEKNVTVAIGIDEAGINDDNDIFQEMRLARNIHREPGLSSMSPTSHQIFELTTMNGSKVTFFEDQIGTLEIGKRADIVLVDTERIEEPYLNPDMDIIDALLFRGKGMDVNTVIVDGEVLLRNKVFQNINKGDVVARLKHSLDRPLTCKEVTRSRLSNRIKPYIEQWFSRWSLEQGAAYYTYNLTE